jgi:hypothetical protein
VHVPDRRVPQAQRVDREIAARLGGEKGGDGFRRRRQCRPVVDRTPVVNRATAARYARRVFSERDARRYCAAASAASSKFATGAGNSAIVSRSNQWRTSSGAAPAGKGMEDFSAPAAGGSGKIAGMIVWSAASPGVQGRWEKCRGVTALPCPLLTGAGARRAEVPWARDLWIAEFLDSLAEEAEDGIALLSSLERQWLAARRAVAGRRRDSRAGHAVDILAAAPLVSATSLGQALGMATKNATRLLEGFVVLGIASEVTHRSKRRLYGLKHLAPLREAAAPPRRPLPGRLPGRPS